jgi:altronate dehydratase small subunit
MRATRKALVLDSRDNVATALSEIEAGTLVRVKLGDRTIELTVNEAIPFAHKFAIKNIEEDRLVYKYGEVIGKAIKPIGVGQHVHTHNLESIRGKADQQQ